MRWRLRPRSMLARARAGSTARALFEEKSASTASEWVKVGSQTSSRYTERYYYAEDGRSRATRPSDRCARAEPSRPRISERRTDRDDITLKDELRLVGAEGQEQCPILPGAQEVASGSEGTPTKSVRGTRAWPTTTALTAEARGTVMASAHWPRKDEEGPQAAQQSWYCCVC